MLNFIPKHVGDFVSSFVVLTMLSKGRDQLWPSGYNARLPCRPGRWFITVSVYDLIGGGGGKGNLLGLLSRPSLLWVPGEKSGESEGSRGDIEHMTHRVTPFSPKFAYNSKGNYVITVDSQVN